MKKLILSVSYCFIFIVGGMASAQSSPADAPENMVRGVIESLIGKFTENRPELEADHSKLYALVDQEVLPHFDFKLMSKSVLGKYRKRASAEQQARFQHEFRQLLVRTYASALFEYTGKEEMTFKPTKMKKNGDRATVKTEVKLAEGPPVPVHYSVIKRDDNSWKVFDVKIDGISLVTNYRSSYAQLIKSKGIEELIRSLAAKNSKAG